VDIFEPQDFGAALVLGSLMGAVWLAPLGTRNVLSAQMSLRQGYWSTWAATTLFCFAIPADTLIHTFVIDLAEEGANVHDLIIPRLGVACIAGAAHTIGVERHSLDDAPHSRSLVVGLVAAVLSLPAVLLSVLTFGGDWSELSTFGQVSVAIGVLAFAYCAWISLRVLLALAGTGVRHLIDEYVDG
jgi:hypothetical protein